MTTTRFYRLCIWLPLLVPALLILLVNVFALRDMVGWVGELVGFSLFYGGIPYVFLALWAMSTIGGRSEAEIRRLMFRAPLLMLAVFVPVALMIGVFVGAPGPWAAVAGLGGATILLLGYFYVGLTLLLRIQIGSRLTPTGT